ncbi:urease accessory protein UreE [Planosporangium flavigriseum]|uniref:Urease accessory protein UreE n=1 Tax=Planosporangium flavigriseum TaxID=373681 RepID=A0A8J3M0A3_9ACTN|nr:urease accessory protein UreE [Planosporangium flavigriseum]NJC66900.1 urease accessory protein UreE [Planosporangium flavigriseum]GIG74355.1 urease accessory protein UreE [Planosporangium flavigriseum]
MLVQSVIGNLDEPVRLNGVKIDYLVLDRWEAQKNRLRKATEAGTDVAVSLDRGSHLRDGDILSWDRDAETAIVARVDLGEVMVVDLPWDVGTAVQVGHALGNQHWPVVVNGARIYVPVAVDRAAMDSVLRTHAFSGVTHQFVPAAEVIAELSPSEARYLFGGAEHDSQRRSRT